MHMFAYTLLDFGRCLMISEDENATTIVCAWAPRTIAEEKHKNDECKAISIWDMSAHVKIKDCVGTLRINLWDYNERLSWD